MRHVIFDTDPGQDDAVAILTALGSPGEIEVLGISAVAGNVPLHHAERNARRIAELAGRADLPVYAGADRPFTRGLVTAEHVHGSTGLNGPDLPEPTMPLREGHAADFIIETVRSRPERSVTIAALGPLTNVALALLKAPDIAGRLEGIVLMGGAYFEVGNITPAAEFNIYVDPEAAAVVFRSGAPITVLPLDATHGMRSTEARIQAFERIGNRTGAAVAAMLRFSEVYDLQKYGWDGAPLHDPCVTAFLLEPTIFEGRAANCEIECASALTRGMTVVDYWGVTDRAHNCFFVRSGDSDRFYALLAERVARLP
ncbi:nucleoside hydrolase [Aureimonas jatrophae]|uniref:Purine nucleosidase n=1 Tax=Aureimonas jatrophae TaxID=1166073 RepID=A0A1H0LSL0_9HYPH|nr:nucleoside hydrolase [Aureimonas jatrophae]MBB3952727.1 purine nucleosidase [Aureimonas jatrophae]SDO71114.1 purine nucleosidase [Aureimonas jatrophae]